MSTRWMAVQFVGDTLRLPIVNKSDMDKPFGSSELEREVRRIVVNPFSDNSQTFVPEAENAKLREELESVGTAAYLYGRSDLKAENAKLRELVRRLISHVEHPPCEGCGFEMNCDGEHVTQCDEWLFMVADARKLGVEVDE